jgi:hypothetical protein
MATTGTELAHRAEGGVAAGAGGEAAERFRQTLGMVREAMLNPDVDADKARVMAELMTGLEDRSLRSEFNRSLNAALQAMPTITRAGIIVIPANRDKGTPERTQGRFARFEDINRVVRPILQEHGLSIRFDIGEANGKTSVRPIIGHLNGETWVGEAMTAPLDTSGAKNNVQAGGSTVSYLKRYTMCAALNIITEGTDDDGSLGKFEIGMPHERTVAVLEEAEAAAGAGTYAEWFPAQSPKDRAWMVESGHHARLGGGLLLPGADPDRGEPRAAPPAGDGGREERRPEGAEQTAEGWTRQYGEACVAARTADDLDRVRTRGARNLRRLQESDPGLYQQAEDAYRQAFMRLGGE